MSIIIAILSAKGGAGKSTCTLGTALALVKRGVPTAVLDLDLENPSLGTICGLTRENLNFIGDLIIPPKWNGIPIASLSLLPFQDFWDTPTMVDEERKHEVIESLYYGVDWGESKVILLDMCPGCGEEVRGALKIGPAATVLITSPQKTSEAAVSRVIVMCREYKLPILGVVENDVNQSGLQAAGENLAARYEVPFITRIPWSREILDRMEESQALPTEPFDKIAQAIVSILPEKEKYDHSLSHDGSQEILPDGNGASQPERPRTEGNEEVPRSIPKKPRSSHRKAAARR